MNAIQKKKLILVYKVILNYYEEKPNEWRRGHPGEMCLNSNKFFRWLFRQRKDNKWINSKRGGYNTAIRVVDAWGLLAMHLHKSRVVRVEMGRINPIHYVNIKNLQDFIKNKRE